MDKLEPLSVIIITHNEEHNIRECLESVAWAGEIIVVDDGSEDATVEIARTFTEHVFYHAWSGFAAQKDFALQKASREWVLSLDADERVPEDLKAEIFTVLQKPDIPYDGFWIPRLSTFLGKFIYHGGWYPGYQLRLFRREKATITPVRVHEGFIVEGPVGYLNHHLLHYTHRSLSESFERLNRYSSLEALDRVHRKKVHWWDILLHPMGAFLTKYIGLKGYRDGMHGFLLALMSAMVKMALYMKIWELQNK